MLGRRQFFRIKGESRMCWRIEGEDLRGEAVITNVSVSGIQFNTTTMFDPAEGCIFLVEVTSGVQPLKSKRIKIKWFKKVEEGGRKLLQFGGDFV